MLLANLQVIDALRPATARIHLAVSPISEAARAARHLCSAATAMALAVLPITAVLAMDERPSTLPDPSAPFGPAGWALVVGLGLVAGGRGLHDGPAEALPRPRRGPPTISTLGTTIAVDAPLPSPRRVAGAEARPATPRRRSARPDTGRVRQRRPTPPRPRARSSRSTTSTSSIDMLRTPPRRRGASDAGGLGDAARPVPHPWSGAEVPRVLRSSSTSASTSGTPNWEHFPPDRGEPGLEAYPRLVKAITASWGTHECRRLLDRLLYDNRGGVRRGFTLQRLQRPDCAAARRGQPARDHRRRPCARGESAARSATLAATPSRAAAAASDADVAQPFAAARSSSSSSATVRRPRREVGAGREHPASPRSREWGNAALAGRSAKCWLAAATAAPALPMADARPAAMAERRGRAGASQ